MIIYILSLFTANFVKSVFMKDNEIPYLQIRSKSWYILPILTGILGGLLGYALLRKDDPKVAKNCLWIGIGMTVGWYVIGYALIGLRELGQISQKLIS